MQEDYSKQVEQFMLSIKLLPLFEEIENEGGMKRENDDSDGEQKAISE